METENTTMYSMIDTEVNLTCSAVGRPDPRFLWYHRDKHITANTINDIGNSTLTVVLDSSHSFGKYKCKAVNDYGATRVYFHIHQGRLPEVPDVFRLLGKSTMSFDIQIGAKHDELFPVLGYRFELILKSDSEDEISWNGAIIHDEFNRTSKVSNVVIHGLKRDSTYLVRAAARNVLGMSDWTNVEEFSTLMHLDHKMATKKEEKIHQEEQQIEEKTEKVEVAEEEASKRNDKQQQHKLKERTTLSPRIVTVPPTEAGVGHCSASTAAILTGLFIINALCNINSRQQQ